jgi:hypothetical protein
MGMGGDDEDTQRSRRARFRERVQGSDRAKAIRLQTTLVLEEARRSYDRISQLRLEQSEQLIEVIDPTPEQRAQIQKKLMDFAIANELNPSREARAAFTTELLASLTAEQRRAVIKHYQSTR